MHGTVERFLDLLEWQKGEFKKDAKPDSVRQRKFNSKPEQKKRRADRNAARRRSTTVKKGEDLDHGTPTKHGRLDGPTRKVPVGQNRAKNKPKESSVTKFLALLD